MKLRISSSPCSSGGSYKYPVSLGPRVTRAFNVSEILNSQAPDVDGNLVPLTVHEGSAEISGSRGETEQIAVGIAAGIYNVQKATCGNPCNTCNGITETELELETFGVVVGGTTTESLIATFNTGSKQDYSSEATWSSYNTSILTLKNPGTATGVSRGSSYAHAITAEEFAAYDSCITSGECPDEQVAATAPGTVVLPTYFGPTGNTAASGDCPSGAVGTFINVSDQVLDQNGNAMQISGITPQEKVCVSGSCQSSYNTFSTPVSTTTAGTFNDTPIGTCFGPPAPTTNVCVTVSVTYQAYIFGPTNTYPITTASGRQDCVKGEKDQISGNPTGYNQTYTSGTVP